MKISLLLSLCYCSLFAQSAKFEIEPLDSLFAHVTRSHILATQEALDNFKNLKDYKWLNLIPGIGYDFVRNTPFVTVTVSQYINFLQRRDDKKYRMIQIQQQAEQDLERILFNLKGLHGKLYRQLLQLETRHEIMLINKQLHELDREAHRNIKINTEEFLRSQRTYLTQQSEHEQFKLLIFQTISEIENITKKTLLVRAPLMF